MKKTLKAVLALTFCIMMFASTMLIASALGNVTNLKATNVTPTSATLTWSAASDADGYQVRPYTGGKYGTTVTTTATTYTAKLTPGASYYFYVRSYDRNWLGRYTYGSWVKVYVKAVPANVTGFKAASLSGGTGVKLSWNAVSGATGYIVQQYKGGKYVNLKVTSGTSYSVTGLTPGTAQTFRVIAYVKYGGKNIYSAAYTTLKATPTYLAPATVLVKNITANSAYVYWSGVTGATAYQVMNNTTGKYVNVTAKGATLTGLTPGTSYTVRIRGWAKVSGKNVMGAWSKTITFQTAPAAVTNPAATEVTQTSAKATWTASKGALGYQVYLYDYATKKTTFVKATTGTSYTVTGLKASSTYRIQIRPYIKATSGYVYGAWAYAYVDTSPVVTTTEETTSNVIALSWDAVRNATRYTVERYLPTEYKWTTLSDSLTEPAYSEAVGKNKGELYRISAYTKNGTLINSITYEATTSDVTLLKKGTSATVSWVAPADAVRYDVYRIPLQGYSSYNFPVLEFSINNGATASYTFNLAPNEYYNYRIYAYNDRNAGSVVADFTVLSGDLVIDKTDASYTAQLLMLANGLNKAKLYQGKATVVVDSYAEMNLEALYFSEDFSTGIGAIDVLIKNGEISGEQLDAFFALLSLVEGVESDDIPQRETIEDPDPVTYIFENGEAKPESGSTIKLRGFIEPSGTTGQMAYLYNPHNSAAWKNGFSSVTTTAYSNGCYKVVAVLKQEVFGTSTSNSSAYYHPGFISVYDALGFSGEGVTNDRTSLGATTITAYIDAEGRVYNYKITSPFSTKFSTSGLGMKMSGTTTLHYKITY